MRIWELHFADGTTLIRFADNRRILWRKFGAAGLQQITEVIIK